MTICRYLPLILIMEKEMVTIRKFPRRGYAGTEGRMLVIFRKIPLCTAENAACGTQALSNTLDCTGI